MNLPHFETLIQTVLGRVQALDCLDIEKVFLDRDEPVDRKECPAVIVRMVECTPGGPDGNTWVLSLGVELVTYATDTSRMERSVLSKKIYDALMSDRTVGDRSTLLTPQGLRFVAANSDGHANAVIHLFSATYRRTSLNA
jgi:hypothetical protein